jgi:hypothetical protein
MTLGEDLKLIVDDLLGNEDIRTTLTLTPQTRTNSNYGYDGSTETGGTATTVYGVPSNYVKYRIGLEKFGDLQEGDLRFIIPADTVIDNDDKVTFRSDNYHVRNIEPIHFNEENVALIVTLNKKI